MPLRKNLIGICVRVGKCWAPALGVVRLICLRYLPQNERTKPNKAATAAFQLNYSEISYGILSGWELGDQGS